MHFSVSVCIFSIIVAKIANFSECASYDFISERGELIYANDTFVKNIHFNFGKVNRTFSAFNASFDIVENLSGQNFLGTLTGYMFLHNEYRFQGTKVTVNLCKIEKANIFSLQEQFRAVGFYIDLCNIKKGHYQLVNFTPDSKYFPDYLPRGKIRANIRAHDGKGTDFFIVTWDYEVRPKKL